jgi:hypothetical protein
VRPGNDIYVVYNHNWREDAILDRFSTLDKRFRVKGPLHAQVLDRSALDLKPRR